MKKVLELMEMEITNDITLVEAIDEYLSSFELMEVYPLIKIERHKRIRDELQEEVFSIKEKKEKYSKSCNCKLKRIIYGKYIESYYNNEIYHCQSCKGYYSKERKR